LKAIITKSVLGVCILKFFALILMLITMSTRTGDSNKAGLTKKVSGTIAWLEVGEIAWLPLDMAYESGSAANFDNLLCNERPRAQVWQSMRSNSLIKYGVTLHRLGARLSEDRLILAASSQRLQLDSTWVFDGLANSIVLVDCRSRFTASLFISRSLDRDRSNFAVGKQQSNEYDFGRDRAEISLKDRFSPSIKSCAEFADFHRSGSSIR